MKLLNLKLFKKNITLEVLCSLLLSFTLFFFGPLEIFLSSPIEFWFSISDVLSIIIISAFLCFVIFMGIQFIISFFGERILKMCSSLLTALGIGFYIQGNWTFINYGKMDGTSINWNNYSGWAIANTIIWILILVIVVLLNFKYAKINIYIISGIITIEALTLITLGISSINSSPKAEFTLRGGEEFQLSSNKNNILVILADGFDGSDFLPVLKEEPDFEQYFDGFTFYENTCGTSLVSEESGITLLTGNQLEVGPTFNENINQAYSKTDLYDILEKNNYRTYLYTHEKMVSPLIADQIANFSETKTKINDFSVAFEKIYKMVFFRYTPHIYKKYFWYTSMDFSSLKSYEEIKSSLYYNYDVYNLIENQGVLAQETDYNVYQFFWIQGPHPPTNTDRYCQKIEHIINMEDENYLESQFEQTIGVVKMYTKLITALKEAGVYDNTTIIFTADHGWDIRANPCLLIKPFNSNGKLNISNAPVSMIADYLPTLEYFITGRKDYGNTIYELQEEMDRDRLLYIYDINSSDRTYNSRKELHYSSNSFSKTVLNRTLSPSDIESFKKSGFSYAEPAHIWTNDSKATLLFNLKEKVDNLQMDISYSTYNGIQPVRIYANDMLITKYEANGAEEKSIIIPGEYIKDGELILTFEFTNAIAPADIDPNNKDSRKLALAFHSLTLSNTSVQYDSNPLSKTDLGKNLSADDIESYAVTGFSNTEHEFIWTDGTKAVLKFNLGDKHNNIQVNLSYHTYNGTQPVSIYANNILITEYEADGLEEKSITIPNEYIKNGELILTFEFTNAIAPTDIDPNNKDSRKLALAFHQLMLSDASL